MDGQIKGFIYNKFCISLVRADAIVDLWHVLATAITFSSPCFDKAILQIVYGTIYKCYQFKG